MKLVSFKNNAGEERTGLYINETVVDLQSGAEKLSLTLPSAMNSFLEGGQRNIDTARKIEEKFAAGNLDSGVSTKVAALLAPVPHPPSCRDAYAFRQHVATARRNRGVDMISEFDQFPVFYFTNHNAVFGEGDVIVESDHLHRLDFELEAAIVIGKRGKNISSSEADEYIAGYTIMNDLSARKLQMEEMKLSLGPAKGKDFATTIGPWLVTPDELEKFRIESDYGDKYDLKMTAHHNGRQVSEGNFKDMNWTFAEIIERVSYGVEIRPGDVIGSGTVGTGCYLELNGSATLQAKERGESYTPVWLADGDEIELAISGLGKLKNRIVKASEDRSILAKKKEAAVA
jgi:fumarylacetoacetate (FAA) hydrolase